MALLIRLETFQSLYFGLDAEYGLERAYTQVVYCSGYSFYCQFYLLFHTLGHGATTQRRVDWVGR